LAGLAPKTLAEQASCTLYLLRFFLFQLQRRWQFQRLIKNNVISEEDFFETSPENWRELVGTVFAIGRSETFERLHPNPGAL
jgi:hypothetical protein